LQGDFPLLPWRLSQQQSCWKYYHALDLILKKYQLFIQSLEMFCPPSTTVPGYVAARVMNEGPKVRDAGASTAAATEYTTYADVEGS